MANRHNINEIAINKTHPLMLCELY